MFQLCIIYFFDLTLSMKIGEEGMKFECLIFLLISIFVCIILQFHG